jgi:hypothetical protein
MFSGAITGSVGAMNRKRRTVFVKQKTKLIPDFNLKVSDEFLISKDIAKSKTTSNNKRRSLIKDTILNLSNNEKKIGEFSSLLSKQKIHRNNHKNNNFVKTKLAEIYYYQYLYNTLIQCIFTLASVLSGILAYEIDYDHKKNFEIYLKVSLWFTFISSIFLWMTKIYDHLINCNILSLNKNIPSKVWRFEYENFSSFLFVFIFLLVHPNPLFSGVKIKIYNQKYNIYEYHSLNSIFLVIMLIRMLYFLKFYLVFSDYHSPRTQRICKMNGIETSLYLSIKANMIKTPYHVYLLTFIIILVYCSFCLRIFERVLDEISGQMFSSYLNAMWCLIITMTTVGYGDFYPSSTLGRAVGIASCIFGVFLISMLIVTITNMLQFQGTEENVFLILQRLKLCEEKDKLAAALILKYIKMMIVINKQSKRENRVKLSEKKENAKLNLLLGLHYFKEKVKEIDSTYPAYSNFDFINDNLEILDETMTNLIEKYEILEKYVEKIAKKIEKL